MNLNKILKPVIFALIIIEIVLSSWLVYKNLTIADVCIIGESCSQVQGSNYGEIFGIKLSYLGLFAFIILLISYFMKEKIFFIVTSIGAAFSVYLLIVQLFILKEICTTCIFIDGIMILIWGTSLVNFLKNKNKSII